MTTWVERQAEAADWCCPTCFDVTDLVARLGTSRSAIGDVTDYVRLDVTTIGSILRRHGHEELAYRVNPGGRRAAAVQVDEQAVLPGLVA